jgi:hypothetical protein
MRLPNGNTLICAGAPGITFEITPEGQVVWQYNLPSFAAGAGRGGGRAAGAAPAGRGAPDAGRGAAAAPGGAGRRGGGFGANAGRHVFRAYRYGPDYPGLAGQTLVAGRPLVELVVP